MSGRTPYDAEIKAVKLLQDRSAVIEREQAGIGQDLAELRARLAALASAEQVDPAALAEARQQLGKGMSQPSPLPTRSVAAILAEAERHYPEDVSLADILSVADFAAAERKVDVRIRTFNDRYGLDGWDYAIAGACGLFAAMLDILFVKAPPRPTTAWTQQVDGVFNRWVQDAFNDMLPPDLSATLSEIHKIGSADASSIDQLLGAPPKTLNPTNHRLRSLAHDPILGFLFGVLDMARGTCTVVQDGRIVTYPGKAAPVDGNIFQLLGRMLGHLLSDVNAPSGKGNRGMGLPAPFMGLLRMLEGIPVGDSTFGRQIEYMYVRGYDFRQFVVTSIPMAIMEVIMRVFYVGKQLTLKGAPFGQTLLDTMPTAMNPRFRVMLAIAYGTASAVNAGKVYVTKNILDANYAAWMGLAWNGFHALRWALLERHLKLWDDVMTEEIRELEALVNALDTLGGRAARLPTGR